MFGTNIHICITEPGSMYVCKHLQDKYNSLVQGGAKVLLQNMSILVLINLTKKLN